MSPDRQDKIFIVSQGNLNDRFDVEFYRNGTCDLPSHFGVLKEEILEFGSGKNLEQTEGKTGYKFIRAQNVKPYYVEGECTYVNDLGDLSPLKIDDILIVRVGAGVCDTAIVGKDFEGSYYSDNVLKVKFSNKILPKFFAIYSTTNIGKSLFIKQSKGSGKPVISKTSLENLNFPFLSIEKQQEIIDIMDTTLAEKKNLENKSEEILNGIDDYILSELGIELEKQEEKMYFSVDLKDIIENNRFDPSYFTNSFKIKKSDYELKNIYDIAEIKKGQSITQDNIIEGEYPVIAGGQTSPYSHSQKNYDGNVITISASGAYSGYVRYHEKPIFASDCSVVFSKDENFISTFFIYTWLKINQKEIYKMQKGAGQPHVYPDDIGNFIIPLPPREIQDKITNEVKSRIEKANELKKQANEIYEQAKNEVEKMILE